MHRSVLSLALFLQQGLATYCPPTGELLPRPKVPTGLDLSDLTSILDGIAEDSSSLGWNSTTTSFSIQATSLDDDFFSYYHTAPQRNGSGTQEVDGDTPFRIASVTKLFTVLAVLLEKDMNLDDHIGKYVEELDGLDGWKDVTIRHLASQIAAVPRNGNVDDHSFQEELLVQLGFPPLGDDDIPTCDIGPFDKPCSREEFLQEEVIDAGFTGKIADRAAYSNLAYTLLGYALENVTGSSYEDIVKQSVTEPLGLSNTGFENPPLDEAIIPAGENWFGGDFGALKATGGIYSTANDMTKFARAILNNDLLTAVETRDWLKPAIFTASLSESVGAPWEIFRPTHLTSQPRPVDHYTKAGDVPGYSAHILLVPEFGLAVTIHAADSNASGAVASLADVVQEVLIPTFDDLARDQANQIYGGEYVAGYNGDPATLSLTIDDGPGLKIANWTNRGKDMLQSFHQLNGKSDARIYPSSYGDRWRVVFSNGDAEPSTKKPSIAGNSCRSWTVVDNIGYGKQPADAFDFELDEQGDVRGVTLPGFRAELIKVQQKPLVSQPGLFTRQYQ